MRGRVRIDGDGTEDSDVERVAWETFVGRLDVGSELCSSRRFFFSFLRVRGVLVEEFGIFLLVMYLYVFFSLISVFFF